MLMMYYKGNINIKNSVLDYVRYKHMDYYGHVRRINDERLLRKFCNGVHLEEENTSKFMDAGSKFGMRVTRINTIKWFDKKKWKEK